MVINKFKLGPCEIEIDDEFMVKTKGEHEAIMQRCNDIVFNELARQYYEKEKTA